MAESEIRRRSPALGRKRQHRDECMRTARRTNPARCKFHQDDAHPRFGKAAVDSNEFAEPASTERKKAS
jgi:hypothetical protein